MHIPHLQKFPLASLFVLVRTFNVKSTLLTQFLSAQTSIINYGHHVVQWILELIHLA